MNTKRRIIITCLLAMGLLLSDCGRPTWPSGTGYLTPATQRPSSPYGIQTQSTKWEIYACPADGLCTGNGEVEYKNSESMAFAPGAVITNRTISQTVLTLSDYNGDECIIPYGMTVRIDEYGQYVPVEYNPDLPPPTE